MTKIYLLINNIVVVTTIIIICAISWCNGIISDKRLCYDPNCSVPVALARTTIRYNSIEPHILSFVPNLEVKIFSKEAGKRLDLWGAEVAGKRGYVPKSMVREIRKLKSNLTYEVPTEFSENVVNKPDPVGAKVDSSDQLKAPQDQKVQSYKTVDEPQALKDGENVSTVAPPDDKELKVGKDKLESPKTAEASKPEKNSVDSPSVPQPPAPPVEGQSIDKKAEDIVEGLRNVVSPYEVIDGTTISLEAEKAPIKPSHSTPTILATAVPDEGPILSVLPNIPATVRPLLATFSNANTRSIEQPQVKQDANVLAENLSSETDSLTQFPPTQNERNDSPVVKSDISRESRVEDDSKANISQDKNFSSDIKPTENSENDVSKSTVPVKNERSNELDSSNSQFSPNRAVGDSSEDSQRDEPDTAKNTVDNSEVRNASSEERSSSEINGSSDLVKENENDQNISPAKLDSSKARREEPVLNQSSPEIEQNQSELHGSIFKEELQDSRQHTEHLSDERIINGTKETNGSNDSLVTAPVDANSSRDELSSLDKAVDDSSVGSQKDESDAAKNTVDNMEVQNASSEEKSSSEINGSSDLVKENENDQNISQAKLDDSKARREEPVLNQSSPEIGQNQSELHGSIFKEELQDSRKHTEHLSDERMINDTKEMNGSNDSVETASERTVKQDDNQVTETDIRATEHDDDKIVQSVDDVSVETEDEDYSQNEIDSTESMEHDYPNDYSNFDGGEETSAEVYPDSGEVKSTTSRNLLTVEDKSQIGDGQFDTNLFDVNDSASSEVQLPQVHENEATTENNVFQGTEVFDTEEQITEGYSVFYTKEPSIQVTPSGVCDINSDCTDPDNNRIPPNEEQKTVEGDDESFYSGFEKHNYLEILLYVSLTAITTSLFSLGYYYIENQRRDQELVGKINVLEKELLVTTKESMMLSESLKAAKTKLNSIEDESFGSNEMVLSLKSELESAQITRGELEDQIVTLEKELESATEAGLELERMLREFLSSQSDENPLAQSVEDLQTRLNAQQATNESLTNSFNLKSQENETLISELAVSRQKCQELEVEVASLVGELQIMSNDKNSIENDYSAKIVKLNKQISKLSGERSDLINQLRTKEMALNDLAEVSQKQNIDGLDFDKLYEASQIKAELQLATEERDELKSKITEVEGAHQLLEEHMKLIKEEIASVTKQYELAERDKTEAQTRLEVLSNYFKEKESQLQKELGMQEALWVQKQGEVTSTVDRIQTMQNEIQNYRQQIETLKREILDQEREYKSQIAALETKSHEQWVIARQSERRLEESKAEASQLRNRLTMVEKSINEVDTDTKLHRLETNGETASSPQLFMGAESSSSPIIFSGSSGVPPLPPSYLYGAPLPPPFIPPPPHSGSGPMYDISRRPPPLGGRLSSPPPMPLHHPPGRYEDAISPPPPLSPPLHPPYNSLRSPPPLPPFGNEHIHSHPPPPFLPPLGTPNSWGDEPLPPLRNPVFRPHQRERLRNHKGSLHSSGDSLDKSNHAGKT